MCKIYIHKVQSNIQIIKTDKKRKQHGKNEQQPQFANSLDTCMNQNLERIDCM